VSDARAFTLTRHCRSTYNADGLLNGDPSIVVLLDAVGREQCEALRERLAGVPFDLGVHTRFPRTAQSLGLILGGRDVPRMEYPEFDDIQLGLFESRDVEEYRAWRRTHGPDERPPGGAESRLDALGRYADGFERLLAEPAREVLAVIHDVPIRFMLNAMEGLDPMEGPITAIPNAQPFRLEEADVRRGLATMRERQVAVGQYGES